MEKIVRQKKKSCKYADADTCWKAIRDFAKSLYYRRLRASQLESIKNKAAKLLENPQNERAIKEQEYLLRILDIDAGYFVASAIVLTQTAIFSTARPVLNDMLKIMEEDKQQETSILHPRLLSYIPDLGLPKVEVLFRRKSSKEQKYANASLSGASGLFSSSVFNGILRVSVNNEIKASILMHFPCAQEQQNYQPPDCYMTLHLNEADTRHIANILFGTTDTDTRDTTNTGREVISLQGHRDEQIIAHLGNDIYNSIEQSSLRKTELSVGRSETSCILMTIINGKGYLNLVLDVKGANKIRDKLYVN
jgi:hypothetical protein